MKDLEHFKNLNESEDDSKDKKVEDIKESPTDEKKSDEVDDKPKDKTDEPDEDESAEKVFIDLFDESGFTKSFQNAIKQYVSETILDDEFNSFTVIPFVEIMYKDETYGLNVEFESAVTINVNDEGAVVEKDIPDVDMIKFKTPEIDNLTNIENQIGIDTISVFIKQSLEDIKKVPR